MVTDFDLFVWNLSEVPKNGSTVTCISKNSVCHYIYILSHIDIKMFCIYSEYFSLNVAFLWYIETKAEEGQLYISVIPADFRCFAQIKIYSV